MPELTNMPDKTKYTPGDAVFIFDLDKVKIKPVTISEWRVEVDNPLNDTTGRQIIYYKFEEVPYEIQEKYVFASENHCLSFLKNDYINRAIESGSGGEGFFKSGLNLAGDARFFGNWTDFAGLDMQGANFVISDEPVLRTGTASISGTAVTGSGTLFLSEYQVGDTFEMFNGFDDPLELGVTIASITDDTHMTLSSAPGNQSGLRVGIILETYPISLVEESEGEKTLVFDNTKLLNANLPENLSDPSDNWADFRAGVRSYDAETTIMPDGNPIDRP